MAVPVVLTVKVELLPFCNRTLLVPPVVPPMVTGVLEPALEPIPMPPVIPACRFTLLAALALLPIVTVCVPVPSDVSAIWVVEASVELPTEPIFTAPVVPPWIEVALVVLVEPIVTVWTAAPVPSCIVWAVVPLNKLVVPVPFSSVKPVLAVLPIVTVPVLLPVLIVVLKLDESFKETVAPVTVKPS